MGDRKLAGYVAGALRGDSAHVSAEQLEHISLLIREGGSSSVDTLVGLVTRYLESNHSQVRRRTLQLADYAFSRSSRFRRAMADQIHLLMQRGIGLATSDPLPPPVSAAAELRKEAAALLVRWDRAVGPEFPAIARAADYLRGRKDVAVSVQLSVEPREQRESARRAERLQTLLRSKFAVLRMEGPPMVQDLSRLLTEMQAACDLLVPKALPVPTGSSRNPAGSNPSQSSRRGEMYIQFAAKEVVESSLETQPLLETLEGGCKELLLHWAPRVHEWYHMARRLDPGPEASDLRREAEDWLRRSSLLRADIKDVLAKCSDLSITIPSPEDPLGYTMIAKSRRPTPRDSTSTAADDSVPPSAPHRSNFDDFLDAGMREVGDEEEEEFDDLAEKVDGPDPGGLEDERVLDKVLELSKTTLELDESRRNRPAVPDLPALPEPVKAHFGVARMDSLDYEEDEAKSKQKKNMDETVVETDSSHKKDGLQEEKIETKTSPPSKVSEVDLETADASDLESLRRTAPVLPYQPALLYWGETSVPLNRSGFVYDNAYFNQDSMDGKSIAIADVPELNLLVMRQQLAWEPVTHRCNAPLRDGRLCPRQDREVCPFHGRIIPRNPTTGEPLEELPSTPSFSASTSSTKRSRCDASTPDTAETSFHLSSSIPSSVSKLKKLITP